MHVAIPLYPRFTALDAVGPYTVLGFAPQVTVTFVAAAPGPVTDDLGSLTLSATAGYADLPHPEVIVVPGGPGTAEAMHDPDLRAWLLAARPQWMTSVCSGSFVLATAGLLDGRRATSHWGWRDGLAAFGAQPVEQRVVTDGPVITAAGVSAGIDMALTLLARLRDDETAQAVQLAVEYDPDPPFSAGSPRSAPPGLAARALALIR
ncbi:DJ-1/PfpI family protein [Actinoplanes sp. NPDC048967]|uniref:DJ-1/PfpI family protein n=1 Tax=Actinoplanes sp. NPDC048967 TaxID=3155269 RepID=UPI0033D11191